jgi:hypothetical protein
MNTQLNSCLSISPFLSSLQQKFDGNSQYKVPLRLISRVRKFGLLGSLSSTSKNLPASTIPAFAQTTSKLPVSLYNVSKAAFCSSQLETSHFWNMKVAEGNSVRRDMITDCADAEEMSRSAILQACEAKKRTRARPMPDAPPWEVVLGKRCEKGKRGRYRL